MKLVLSDRLLCVASLVPKDSFLIDVGTDHAYLPVYMLNTGVCRSALAADINAGPIERAKENIARYSLSDRISVMQTDGLNDTEDFFKKARANGEKIAVTVAGMGGDLISMIIASAPFVGSDDVTLVLQPMTKSDFLRKYLAENGFEIVTENNVFDSGKLYEVFSAEYGGNAVTDYTEAEYLVGKAEKHGNNPLFAAICNKRIEQLRVRLSGMKKSENITEDEIASCEALISELEALKNPMTKS